VSFVFFLPTEILCSESSNLKDVTNSLSSKKLEGSQKGYRPLDQPGNILSEACSITNELHFVSGEMNENIVSGRIRDLGVSYTKKNIQEIKENINNCQNYIDGQITNIKMNISTLVSYKQSILQNGDIPQLMEQIHQNYESKKKIREELKMNLSSINYKGLFLTVLRYKSTFESKKKLSEIAKHLATKKAINDLCGVFLKGLTRVKEGKLVKDYIRASISGQMVVEKNYISKANPSMRTYINLSKMAVSPLKRKITEDAKIRKAEGYEHLVFHLGREKYVERLKKFGIPDAQIRTVTKKMNTFIPIVDKENNREARRERDAIKNTARKLNGIDKTIAELKRDIDYKRWQLTKTYQDIGLSCPDKRTPENCIDEAIHVVDLKIQGNKERLLRVKGNELLIKESSVRAESDPTYDIAKQAIGLVHQIVSSYSTVEKLLERTEVEDGTLSDYEMKRDISIVRELERFWIFVIPEMEDSFGLLIVVKFRIKDLPEHRFATTRRVPRNKNVGRIEPRKLKNKPVILPEEQIVKKVPGKKEPFKSPNTIEDKQSTKIVPQKKEPVQTPEIRHGINKTKLVHSTSPRNEIISRKTKLRCQSQDLSETDFKTMLSKNSFFDMKKNKSGDFKNDFVNNGNGTVTDKSTGLMWQRGESFETFEFEKSKNYIREINNNQLGGHRDWRLPTLEELASLMENRRYKDTSDFEDDVIDDSTDIDMMAHHKPKSETLYFDPVFGLGQMNLYWSGDRYSSYRAWGVNFYKGYSDLYFDNWLLSVKAVRTIR